MVVEQSSFPNIFQGEKYSVRIFIAITVLAITALFFDLTPKDNGKSNFGIVAKEKEKTNYIWPVDGEIISDFGAPRKTWHNGIDIDMPEGTPIYAAAAGKVIYAGEQANVYGLMILISHSDGSTTMYAHNAKNRVKNGQKVKQGELIGYVGKSGNADFPKLHFSIFSEGEALNPLDYLPKQKVVSNSTKYNWPVNADIFSKSGKQLVTRIENTKAVTGRISLEINEEQKTNHLGIDIYATEGTPVLAADDGKVIFVGEYENKLKMIVKHSDGIFTSYTPISAKSTKKSGEKVKRGEQIALVGETDSDTIPHLHFEIQRKGEFLDPFGKGFLIARPMKKSEPETMVATSEIHKTADPETTTETPKTKVPEKETETKETVTEIPKTVALKETVIKTIVTETPKVLEKVSYMWPIQNKIYPDRASFKGGNGSGFISSEFGDGRNHAGLDLAFGDGTKIQAAASGTVSFVGCDSKCGTTCDDSCRKGYGKYIKIAHPDGKETRYAHLQEFKVTKGNTVSKGDLIGLVGHTGTCRSATGGTGAHLHFEIREQAKPIDPMRYLPRIK